MKTLYYESIESGPKNYFVLFEDNLNENQRSFVRTVFLGDKAINRYNFEQVCRDSIKEGDTWKLIPLESGLPDLVLSNN